MGGPTDLKYLLFILATYEVEIEELQKVWVLLSLLVCDLSVAHSRRRESRVLSSKTSAPYVRQVFSKLQWSAF